MPPVARSARKKSQQQTYNIVVASYVLGELPSPQEKAALLRELWSEFTHLAVSQLVKNTIAGRSRAAQGQQADHWAGRCVAQLHNAQPKVRKSIVVV